jgi:hypothetical protein
MEQPVYGFLHESAIKREFVNPMEAASIEQIFAVQTGRGFRGRSRGLGWNFCLYC